MPFDLLLKNGDIVIDPFDIQLNSSGLQAVGQRLAITLNTFKEEFFLNTQFGTPWFQTIFRKGVSKNLIDAQLRSVISSVEGVLQLIEYQSDINPALRTLSVTFKARIDEGIVNVVLVTGGGVGVGNYITESGFNYLQEDGVSVYLLE